MRTLITAFWAIVALCLVVLGLANRDIVRLRVLPQALSDAVGMAPDIDLPLFLVILSGFALGLLVGFIWEYIREIPERAAARSTVRELERLRAEIGRLRGTIPVTAGERPDVLALIDAPLPSRR